MDQASETNTMKLSLQLDQPTSQVSDSDGRYMIENQSIVVPAKLVSGAPGFEKKEQSWSAMSQIPTDLSVHVQEITFHVHQFPLVSRCAYFSRIEVLPSNSGLSSDIKLENFPGGSETFETILKFCYDLPINLNPNNVATLRCAAEYLEMTEALEDGNLISKTEAFFTFVVLSSWRDSITVLRSCETLSPWAENLQIVRRCCDSIAWKISREPSTTEEVVNEQKWWFEEMATLKIGHFTRIITAIRSKGMAPKTIGSCIMRYGDKWLPTMESDTDGLGRFNYGRNELQWSITSGKRQEGDIGHVKEHRTIVESLVNVIPPQKEAVTCKFLLNMLKMAVLYSASPALVSMLEQRVGMVLENASVNDLLIPNCPAGDQVKVVNSSEGQTMHNVDVVQRILEYFLLYEQQQQHHKPALLAVSKLLDSYLAEIARDPKLSVTKFQYIAQCLPENARTCDDGLYRAIDTYLKAHPALSEHEQRRLGRVMDCGKLSVDACSHAAKNDRLPLRTMIEVLFSEQVKIRAMMMQGKVEAETGDNTGEEGNNCSSTDKEVKALKLEVERVKMQMAEMRRDHSELQQEHERLNLKKERHHQSGWALGWRRIRKSALFNLKIDGEETDDSQSRANPSHRGSFRRRQSIS